MCKQVWVRVCCLVHFWFFSRIFCCWERSRRCHCWRVLLAVLAWGSRRRYARGTGTQAAGTYTTLWDLKSASKTFVRLQIAEERVRGGNGELTTVTLSASEAVQASIRNHVTYIGSLQMTHRIHGIDWEKPNTMLSLKLKTKRNVETARSTPPKLESL